MSLLHFPDEIFEHIISSFLPFLPRLESNGLQFLDKDEDHQEVSSRQLTLSRLGRTCQRLCRLTLPALYFCIVTICPEIFGLLGENAHRASNLVAVDLDDNDGWFPEDVFRSSVKIVTLLPSLPKTFRAKLVDSLDTNSNVAAACLCLFLFPNLKTLIARCVRVPR